MKHEERNPVVREFNESGTDPRKLYEMFKHKKQIEDAISDITTEIVIDGWSPNREYKTDLTILDEDDDRFELVIIIKPKGQKNETGRD